MSEAMKKVVNSTVDEVYDFFKKKKNTLYNEEKHCKLLIKVMMDKNKGCHTYFCVEAMVGESTFYHWVRNRETFGNLFFFTKMVAKQCWYEEGMELRSKQYLMGTINYEMDHWKLMGWAKFGISRNSRIRINFGEDDSPAKHYQAILRQAADGDFTASEFKQLMEAVNVGLNVHQTFELQKQIDELKSDLLIVTENSGVQNPFTDKGIAQKD
jgi:hypothetical protein